MIHDLKPYSEMRDSGVTWLGKVPAHWDECRAGYLFREFDKKSTTGTETHLSMSQRLGLVPNSEMDVRGLVSASYVGAKLCEPGDLVLNRLKAHLGVFAIARHWGLISPDYAVFRRASSNVLTRFFESVLKSSACRGELRIRSKGLVEGFWRLYTDDFYAIKLPLPPLPEQSAIVRFIAHADRRIRRYITAKKKLIALLNEQKQAIIHRAVTRGIDPNVRLKPSGVEWLGDVPEHWNVLRSRYLFREVDHRSEVGAEAHLSMSQKLGLVPSSMVEQRTLVSQSYAGAKLCEQDDLVLNRLKAHLGVFAVARQGGVISPDYTVLRKIQPMAVQYFEHVLRSPACRVELRVRAKGIVQGFWRLYTDDFYDIRVPVPPANEQRNIVDTLDCATKSIQNTIERTELEIELLREYRTRLIADVITGKLDVREAAARLPDEADDSEPFDDADALTEVDDADPDATSEEAEG